MSDSSRSSDFPTIRMARRAFAVLAGVALVIGGALVLFPGDTAAYFAWTIKAPIAAVTLGAWFLGLSGFTWAASRGPVSAIPAAASAVALGSALMLAATLVHRVAFNWGSPAAWLWLLLYLAAPPSFAALAFILREPAAARKTSARTSTLFRVAALAGAGIAGGCGVILFLWPPVLIPSWPWPLLPLGARTYAAFTLGYALWAWRLARSQVEPSGAHWPLAVFPLTAFVAPWVQSATFRASSPGGILFLFLTGGLAGLATCALWAERNRTHRSR